MFLKNYTSNVPSLQTIFKIEQVLIKCGVSGITKEYGAKCAIAAITFHIKMPEGHTMTIRLPADCDAACQALWLDYVGEDKVDATGLKLECYGVRKKKSKKDFQQQAERTAWKIVQDWVEVQMSMIQLRQADVVQVFLPYVWDGTQTFYSRLQGSGFRALLPERTE